MNRSILYVVTGLMIPCLAGCTILTPSGSTAAPEGSSADATSAAVTVTEPSVSGSLEEPSDTSDTSESSGDTYAPLPAQTYEDQIREILDEPYTWETYMPDGAAGNMISFTDLDLDGNVELIVARTEGDEFTTSFEFYEYDPSVPQRYSFIVAYDRTMANTPDIMADKLDAYYDDTQICYGISDISPSGTAGRNEIKYLMSLRKDFLMFEPVATGMYHVDEGGDLGNYFDIRDNRLTKSEYDRITDTTACGQMGLTKTSVTLSWFHADDTRPSDAAQFAGTVACITRQ
ncbi:MAG: hypothetical protein IKH76_11250 [Clostridiales bacterium]|nr:hypothetical protein [Clostridiales bacterium]